MRLDNQRESSNVEDRRGDSSGGLGGGGYRQAGMGIPLRGGSLVTIAVLVGIGWLVFGINPLQMLSMLTGGSGSVTQEDSYQPSSPRSTQTSQNGGFEDAGKQFVSKVLGSTEDVWTEIFAAGGKTYKPTPLVLFSGATGSACGTASSATGPF